jgi:hypothetical protein
MSARMHAFRMRTVTLRLCEIVSDRISQPGR